MAREHSCEAAYGASVSWEEEEAVKSRHMLQRLWLWVFTLCFWLPLAVLLSLSLSSLQRLRPFVPFDPTPTPSSASLRDFSERVCVCVRVFHLHAY